MWKCLLLFWKLGRLRWLMMMLIISLTLCLISMSLELPGLITRELFLFRPFAELGLLDEEEEAVRVEQRQILEGKLWNQRWNAYGKAKVLRSQRTKEAGAVSRTMKRKHYEGREWEAWLLNHLKRRSRNESLVVSDQKRPEKPALQWKGGTLGLRMFAQEARIAGGEAWKRVEDAFSPGNGSFRQRNLQSLLVCPMSISTTGEKVAEEGGVVQIPCGLAAGSSVTVMATPLAAHSMEQRQKEKQEGVGLNRTLVSHFVLELQALNSADSRGPPRLLHVNPRLKGDWSGKPVIEHNTCYRGEWGVGQRCEGWQTADYVDGLIRCEEWSQDGDEEQPKSTSWLTKLLRGSTNSVKLWGFPFSTGKIFILTIRAGWHGYHLAVDGRHISSYSYQKDLRLEEATGLYIGGDIDLHAVVITSLPSHPSFSSERDMKMSHWLKAPPKAKGPISLFVGIVSKATHFVERMTIRKTWLQSSALQSMRVVARFFVALGSDQDVNVQIKQEADFFGDIVVLTYMDHYNLVVLKTIAICEYGIRNTSTKYIMKCDDDTFVSLERILMELKTVPNENALYMGNINQLQKPLRVGKWAVSYEEWPKEVYPLYADGTGYIITADIAEFVVFQYEKGVLQLFKMEDVSMGLWVSQFAVSKTVRYVNRAKFCQWGCVDGYFTAHYLSARQMSCLWVKHSRGESDCCKI